MNVHYMLRCSTVTSNVASPTAFVASQGVLLIRPMTTLARLPSRLLVPKLGVRL